MNVCSHFHAWDHSNITLFSWSLGFIQNFNHISDIIWKKTIWLICWWCSNFGLSFQNAVAVCIYEWFKAQAVFLLYTYKCFVLYYRCFSSWNHSREVRTYQRFSELSCKFMYTYVRSKYGTVPELAGMLCNKMLSGRGRGPIELRTKSWYDPRTTVYKITSRPPPGRPRRPLNRLGDVKIHLNSPLGDPRPLPLKEIRLQQKRKLSKAYSTLLRRTTQYWMDHPTFLQWWSIWRPKIFALFTH